MIKCCVQLKVFLKSYNVNQNIFTINYIYIFNKYVLSLLSFFTDRTWSMNEFLTVKKFISLNLTDVESGFFLKTVRISILAISFILELLSNFNMHATKWPEFYFSCSSNLLSHTFIEKEQSRLPYF